MRTIQILEKDDIIQRGDFCRPLDLDWDGDFFTTTSAYSGTPINYMEWLQVERASLDHWIGKTVGAYNEKMRAFWRIEVIRGDVPQSHIMPPYGRELHEVWNKMKFTFGKYKGRLYRDIKSQDRRYFNWCLSKGYVKDEPND